VNEMDEQGRRIMTDIVERLRAGICGDPCKVKDARSGCECAEAADEIERLRTGYVNQGKPLASYFGVVDREDATNIARMPPRQEPIMTGTTHPVDAAIEALKKLNQRGDNLETFDIVVHEIVSAALPALTAYREGMGEPFAWTGSGSIMAVEDGREGFIWNKAAEAHPIPLYLSPPDASALAEEVKRLRDALKNLTENIEHAFPSLSSLGPLVAARAALAKEPTDV
jgi:hypothetical protein